MLPLPVLIGTSPGRYGFRMKTSFLIAIAVTLSAAPALAAPVAETDFLNFTYQAGQEKVTVTNGEFSRNNPSNRLFFKVLKVRRGDLNGDGVQIGRAHV